MRLNYFVLFLLSLSLFTSVAEARKPKRKKIPKSHVAPKVDGLLLPQRLVLTFDDGPDLTLTPKVLDLLDEQGFKAIFFVNGWRFQWKDAKSEKARELLREMIRRGHFVGNHTVKHSFLCGKKGPDIAEKEIVDNAQLIEEATGIKPFFFRTPFGSQCAHLSALFKKLGIEPTGWSVDPFDWKWRDRYKNLAGIQQGLSRLPRMQKPVIILMHDIHKETIETLPLLFSWLKTKPNFTVVNPVELTPKPKIAEEMKTLFSPLSKMFHKAAKSFNGKRKPLLH